MDRIAQRDVLELGGLAGVALPDFKEAAPADELVVRRGPALSRVSHQDKSSVLEQGRRLDSVGVDCLAFSSLTPLQERNRPPAQFGDALRIGIAEEMAGPVRVVAGKER